MSIDPKATEGLFENPGLEFRLQAAERGNRLKAELRTPPG